MGQVLAFNPSRARSYLHGLRGAAHRYAWRYYRFLQGKARRSPPQPRRLLKQTANIIRQAIKIGMGLESAARPAPATFAGWQELPPKMAARLGRKREPMFQLTAGIPGHPERSHVSGDTLVKAGFTLPEIPEPNGLIWTGDEGRNPAGQLLVNGVVYEILSETQDRQGALLMIRRPKGRKEYLARRLPDSPLYGEARGYIIHALATAGGGPITGSGAGVCPKGHALHWSSAAHPGTAQRRWCQLCRAYFNPRRSRRRMKHNPPRRPGARGGARLIYPSGRIVGVWEGRHKNGKLYRHKFGRGLKSIYGLPGGDLLLTGHQGR